MCTPLPRSPQECLRRKIAVVTPAWLDAAEDSTTGPPPAEDFAVPTLAALSVTRTGLITTAEDRDVIEDRIRGGGGRLLGQFSDQLPALIIGTINSAALADTRS